MSSKPYHDRETLIELHHEQRLTQTEIAEKFGVDSSTISNWFSKHDIEVKTFKEEQPFYDRDLLVELYHHRRMTTAEIGELFGVSSQPIKTALHKLGIDTRRPRPQDVTRWIDKLAVDGVPPTAVEFGEKSPHSVNAPKRLFGTHNNAVKAAGYDPNFEFGVTKEDLIEALLGAYDELGHSPTQGEIDEYTGHSSATYHRKFDRGLRGARERVGLKNYRHEPVQVKCDYCGGPTTKKIGKIEESQFDFCSPRCHHQHRVETGRYEGENNPASTLRPVECEACGDKMLRARWERDLKDRFYCSDCWGDARVEIICEWCQNRKRVYPALEDQRFCSRKCHGEWQSVTRVGENHPRWLPGRRPEYYGPNWYRQRRKALERDQFRCQRDGCSWTIADSFLVLGESLSVHHITAFREFETDGGWDYESANRLENLMSVCRPCHSEIEGQ